MAGKKKVKWSLNVMLMLGELYDYLEERMGDDKAAEYLDELMDLGMLWKSNQPIFHFAGIKNSNRRVTVALLFAKSIY